MSKSEKPTRRSSTRYPALEPKVNLKSRGELIDYDYIHKLSSSEKEWLNKFTEEYVNDALDRKDLSNNLHNTQKLKKDCGDRNNSRNRDVLTKQKAMGLLNYLEEIKEPIVDNEDKIIDSIDANDEKKTPRS